MSEGLASLFDAALFDLDGVLYRGANAVPHAVEAVSAVRAQGLAPVFVTNNASRTPEVVAEQLNSLGIEADASDVLGSAHVGVELAEQILGEGARVLLCGGEGLRVAAAQSSLKVVESADDHPDGVIHGFAPETNWEMLSEAALAIRAGARYIATNLDPVIPRERGLMVGMGSLAAAITRATGVEPIAGAKPEAPMFRTAARKARATRPLVVGDNLETDILGATNSQIPALHVLTGTHTARDVICAQPAYRPQFLGDDLRCLAEEYPSIVVKVGEYTHTTTPSAGYRESDAWAGQAPAQTELAVHVAGHEALAHREGVRLDGAKAEGALSLNAYRALAHAVWLALDLNPGWRERIEASIGDVEVKRG